jgi:hypothetical protein
VVLLGLTAVLPAASQSPTRCTLGGFVVDPQGLGVPGASVRLALENGDVYFSASNSIGYYTVEFPLPSATTYGLLYVQLHNGQRVLQMIGGTAFRSCRQERNVFVNGNRDVTPGPPVPSGPGVPPPYPGPGAPPPDSLSEVVIYLDPRALPLGGLAPGDQVRLPICVSNVGARGQPIQIDQVNWGAAFLPDQLHLSTPSPILRDFERVLKLEIDYSAGRITYSAASSDPVTLPRWPECTVMAMVDVTARETLQPGDIAWLMSLSGTSARLADQSSPGVATRMTTYVDIVPRLRIYLPIVPRRTAVAP